MATLRQALVVALILSLWSFEAAAQSDDAVVVVSSGGVRHVQLFDLEAYDGTIEAFAAGRRRILPDSAAASTFTDIKVLPDGSFLLADASGRGFMVSDADGALRYELRPPNAIPSIASASVVSYLGPGAPHQVLMGDNATSRASVYDIFAQGYSWSYDFGASGSRAVITQAIAMPGERIAAAVNWPAQGLSSVDVFKLGPGEGPAHRRFANIDHFGGPRDLVIVEGLNTVRDLMARADGSLLVTTRFSLLSLSPAGEVLWQLNVADDLALNGELATARWLPSGRIALASFEPGHWVRPHTNHRIHWIDPSSEGAPSVVATSEVLDAAPVRLDALRGHGGTGTFGFETDGGEPAFGDASALVLSAELIVNAMSFRSGDRLSANATLLNPGAQPIALERVGVVGLPGRCGSPHGTARTFFEYRGIRLESAAAFEFDGAVIVDPSFVPGPWCVFVSTRDRFLVERAVGDPIEIEIEAERIRPPDVRDVELLEDVGEGDVGFELSEPPTPAESEQGCACRLAPGSGTLGGAGWLASLAIVLALARVRKRRQRPLRR
ncbi:MAG: hypothetical protein H0U74_01080 [Bradymonadaceae bacterium]|nr:hypothetical protein [Lujinxingiaceae bacterium]